MARWTTLHGNRADGTAQPLRELSHRVFLLGWKSNQLHWASELTSSVPDELCARNQAIEPSDSLQRELRVFN